MANPDRRPWARAEILKALSLYCVLPFGRFHRSNPEVIALAKDLSRTSGSVALKLCNLASLDPHEKARGISGMTNASRLDREVWTEFYGRWAELAEVLPIVHHDEDMSPLEFKIPRGPTTKELLQRVRRGQQFFRKAVLSAYANRCCITGIADPDLLRASHIVPWSKSEDHRLNPSNGLCLNALHDAAFDIGLLTIDEKLCVVLSRGLAKKMPKTVFADYFQRYDGREIERPERFPPDEKCLHIHRTTRFIGA